MKEVFKNGDDPRGVKRAKENKEENLPIFTKEFDVSKIN